MNNRKRNAFLVIAAVSICIAAWACVIAFTDIGRDENLVDITPGSTPDISVIATATPEPTTEPTTEPTVEPTTEPTSTPIIPEFSHDPNKKAVALSFDDGPGGAPTGKILDLLEQYGVHATFFVVGTMLEANPDKVQRAYEMGCEIGNHTYDHEVRLKGTTAEVINNALTPVDNMLLELIGTKAKFIRPPWGAYDDTTCSSVDRPLILWSVDPEDWKSRNCDSVVAEIKENVFDGAIILMHDIYASTADACEIIIPWLIEQNYDIMSVGELLAVRGIVPQGGVAYRMARPPISNGS